MNNDLFTDEAIKEIALDLNCKRGIIPELNIGAALQQISKTFLCLQTQFALLGKINFRIHWNNIKINEEDSFRTTPSHLSWLKGNFADRFKRVHHLDNLITTNTSALF